MDAGGVTAIRLPYRHLRDAEMELVNLNGSPRSRSSGESPPKQPDRDRADTRTSNSSTRKLVLACMVAAGVQFGWALQLSLLTPYIQERLGWVVGSAHLGASGDVFFLPFLFSVTPQHTEYP